MSVDRLVDSLWGDHDGDGAEIALRSTISRLRKRLREAGAARGPDRDPRPGLRARGRRRGRPTSSGSSTWWPRAGASWPGAGRASRRACSTEAQELWRGPAYSEVRDEPFARAEARRLEELLLAAIETRIDAGLTLGRHESLARRAGDADQRATRCASGCGRSACWRSTARAARPRRCACSRTCAPTLVAELGIEPGHDVAWMEHAILAQDPALDFPVPPEPGAGAADVEAPGDRRPRTATASGSRPPSTRDRSSGASRESALLRDWWASVREGDGRLLLVDGDPGIGKTRLVGELARAVEARRRARPVGSLRRGPGGAVPALRRGARPVLPSLSADRISRMPDWQLDRALPPRPPPARVRAAVRGGRAATRRTTASGSSRR